MANGVVFHVLDVGQGDGNFIEVFANGTTNSPTQAILVDFGSAKSARIAGPKSTEFIVDRLSVVTPPSGVSQLGLVVLSHSDADHINLIPELLDQCAAKNITIGDCIYSGEAEHYIYRGKNILQLIKDYAYPSARNLHKFTDSYSSFAVSGWPTFITAGGLEIRILIVNAPGKQVMHHRTKRKRNEPNAGSLCLVCSYGGVRVVLTGDATYATFNALNSLLKAQGATGQVADTVFLKIPHHGSSVTLADEGDKEPYKQAIDFTALCQPTKATVFQAVTASADFHIGFRHPSKEIVDLFSKYAAVYGYNSPSTEPGSPQHRYSAYEGSDWDVFTTSVNTYTTMYTKNARVQWAFSITDSGGVATTRIPDAAIALLFHRVSAPFARAPFIDSDRTRRLRTLVRALKRKRR